MKEGLPLPPAVLQQDIEGVVGDFMDGEQGVCDAICSL